MRLTSDRATRRRAAGAALAVPILLALLAGPAAADDEHPPYAGVQKWWQHEKIVWKTGWPSSPDLVADHERWHENHPSPGEWRHQRWHRILRQRWREAHFHRAMAWQAGEGTWYDWYGQVGACGVPLHDNFAASRRFECGSLVSVRHGRRYTIVEIQDSGPWGDFSRIIDLNPKSFAELAPPGAGVIDVKVTLLNPQAVRQLE